MPDTDPARLSIRDITAAYRARDLSPVEVARECFARIDRHDGELRAFQSLTHELALSQAQAAERAYADGGPVPALLGVPISIKDAFHVRGEVTTLGSWVHRDQVSKSDSGVVSRLRSAGAVFIGKTNTAEFGQSATTENRLGRDTANPWDTTRTPGGSSGGAAASVAAGLSTAAVGSDGGGSVRIPAAFTGLFGFKPTAGLVRDERGFRAMSDFVCPGPLTSRVSDARRVLSVLADTNYSRAQPDRPLRIGLVTRPEGRPIDPRVAAVVETAAKHMAHLGHSIEEIDLPISGWNDVFGPLVLDDEHRERGHLLDGHADELTRYERSTLRAARALGVDAATWALEQHPRFQQRVDAVFDDCDIVLTPATAVPAFRLGERPEQIDGQPVDQLWGAFPFAVPFNVAGTPAASVPCGLADGLPVGVQLVARRGQDGALLDACELLEEAVGFDRDPVVRRWSNDG